MEEKFMVTRGFVEIDSSDLYVRGGVSVFEKIVSKVKAIVNFIADYVPNFAKGLIEGFRIL